MRTKSLLAAAVVLTGTITATAPSAMAHATRGSVTYKYMKPVTIGKQLHALSNKGCQGIRVVLHGMSSPDLSCQIWRHSAATSSNLEGSGPEPNTVNDSWCGWDDVILNRSAGDQLCFIQTGFVNLTDYGGWNDAVTSYSSGHWAGRMYANINGGGISFPFYYAASAPVPSNMAPGTANAVSSLCIGGSFGGAERNCP